MNKYNHIIWDFNGTLLNDVDAGIRAVNQLLCERGLAPIQGKEHYRRIFRFPVIEYYRSLGFDFDREPYEVIAPKWVELYLENVKQSGLYEDVLQTLELIRSQGIKQSVLSATEYSMLCAQLEYLGIKDRFDEIMGLDNIHAGSKLALAKAWRARNEGARVLLIGDTDHDLENARELRADCVLVSRGHQSREHLVSLGAKVEQDLSGVVKYIKEGL